MAESIFSPDGKWMWTGSDWIPAPDLLPPADFNSRNVVGGDVNITITTLQISLRE